MIFRSIAVGSGILALLVGSALSGGADTINPVDKIKLEVMNIGGSGCPKDSTSVRMNEDNTKIAVWYRDFVVEAGPNSNAENVMRSCQLTVRAQGADGYAFAIGDSNFSGYANIEDGVSGVFRSTYYTMGATDDTHLSRRFEGSFNGMWNVRRDKSIPLVWSSCDGDTKYVNIKQELGLEEKADSARTSFMTIDQTDHRAQSDLHIAWKKC